MRLVALLVAAAALALSPARSLAGSGPAAAVPQPDRSRVAAGSGAAAQRPTVLELRRPAEEEWFGQYLVGKKLGYSRAWTGLQTRDARQVLVARAETTISGTVGDRTVKRTIADEKVYEARPGGRLLAFSSRQAGDGGDRTIDGRCTPEGCTVVLAEQGRREERRVAPFGETSEQADPARLAAARHETVAGEQYDLLQLRVKRVEYRYAGTTRVAGAGVETEVAVVEQLTVGERVPTRILIAHDGRVVEERLGDVVAKAEPQDVAVRLDKVDLFGMTRVVLPAPIERRAVPGRVVFRLAGVPPEFQVADARQRWARAADGTVELTVTARRPAAADPAHDAPRLTSIPKDMEDLLAPTPHVDSDAPEIQKLAREVVGDTRGTYAAAVKLSHFVNGRLEKAYGVSRDRATEVLELGKGDCTEHTLLFTALARAAGIPTRQVHGLVYARYGDGVPALYWHAWAEVRSGDEWIAVDPTFDQPVADATHVLLGREPMVDTVGLLGSLKVASAQASAGG